MKKINLETIDCNVAEFFERFGATLKQQQIYTPLFLAIHQSQYGELSPSFGIFRKGEQIYTVYGDECSVWDFNGQFKPELSNLEFLETSLKKQRLGMIDNQDIFYTKLVTYIDYLKTLNIFPNVLENTAFTDYTNYTSSQKVGYLNELDWKQMSFFKENFQDYQDEGMQFYKFTQQTSWHTTIDFFINHCMEISCSPGLAQTLGKDSSTIKNLISDIKGSLELGENIFLENQKITKKLKL
jgi:hypothetical protein